MITNFPILKPFYVKKKKKKHKTYHIKNNWIELKLTDQIFRNHFYFLTARITIVDYAN